MNSRSYLLRAAESANYVPGCQNPVTKDSFFESEDTARYFCGACAVRAECLADELNGVVLLGTKPTSIYFQDIKAGLGPEQQLAVAVELYNRPFDTRNSLITPEQAKAYLP